MICLLSLFVQRVGDNRRMLSLLNYIMGKNTDLCASEFLEKISPRTFTAHDVTTAWIVGRVALACDNATAAYEFLSPLTEMVENNPLLYQDVVVALSTRGDFRTLEAVYQRYPPSTGTLTDTLTLAYIEHTEDYTTILRFDPGNLYATYQLWQQAVEAGDFAQIEVYSDTLNHFPLSVIAPKSPCLFEHISRIVPQLFEKNIWSYDKLKNVVTFWVWQRTHPPLLIELLLQLMSKYPDEPDWSFLLAELYHRQGDLDLAKKYYNYTLSLNVAYKQAYLRLGMVYEELIESSDLLRKSYFQAAQCYYYEYYHKLAPMDMFGSEKLADICVELNVLQSNNLYNFTIYTDPQQIASEILDIPIDRVSLSPNLLPNNWLAATENWRMSNMSNYEPFSRALYVIGTDTLEVWNEVTPGRVVGLWLDWESGYSQSRAGFWSWYANGPLKFPIQEGEQYLIVVNYSAVDEKTSIWLSNDAFVSVQGDLFLPMTDGEIRWFAKILDVRAAGEANCLIRYWGEKSALFYNVSIYKVQQLP